MNTALLIATSQTVASPLRVTLRHLMAPLSRELFFWRLNRTQRRQRPHLVLPGASGRRRWRRTPLARAPR